jgi:hypothetical protein
MSLNPSPTSYQFNTNIRKVTVCKRRIIVQVYTLWQAMHTQELQYPERKMPGSYLILDRCTADYWLYQVRSREAHRATVGNVVDRCRIAIHRNRKYGKFYNKFMASTKNKARLRLSPSTLDNGEECFGHSLVCRGREGETCQRVVLRCCLEGILAVGNHLSLNRHLLCPAA